MKKYTSPKMNVNSFVSTADIMINSDTDIDIGELLALEESERQAAAQRAQQD